MKAMVLEQTGQPLHLRQRPDPMPGRVSCRCRFRLRRMPHRFARGRR